jgi:hypothetical protein
MDGLRAVAGVIVAGLLAAALPAVAGAATYSVWSCRGPDGTPASAQAWQADSQGPATADSCASGGYLRARLQPPADNALGTVRGYRFLTPPGATIAGYRIYLFAATADSDYQDAYQAGLDVDPGIGAPTVQYGCTGAGCIFGAIDTPLDPANLIEQSDLAAGGLFVGVKCADLFGCFGQDSLSSLASIRLFGSEVSIRDDHVPVVGAATGTLAGPPQPVSGARTIGGAVSDEGGGIASVVLLVDGKQFAQAPPACAQPYTAPTPCPPDLVASFDVDSAQLSAGAHSAELRATDAAGNSATGPAVIFTVADPPAPSAQQQTPVVVPVEPTAVRLSAAQSRVAIGGKSRRVTGSVKLIDGRPVAGARVIVRSRPFGVRRSAARVERRVTADADGRFSLLADGSSRLLELDVDDSSYRAEEAVEVQLLQHLQVEASQKGGRLRNGSVMTLHTDVDGAGNGARGKGALVQAIVGGRWTTVEELTLDGAGKATWRYRFRGTTRSAVYRFRVRVPTAGDVWPWPTTDSPVLRVKVRR